MRQDSWTPATLIGMCLLHVACGPPAGVGCYEFDWGTFDQRDRVPVFVVPDAVVLRADRGDDGARVADPRRRASLATTSGHEAPWYDILVDRRWHTLGDSIVVDLADPAFYAWRIQLGPDGDGWTGVAVFRTSVGGGTARSYSGPVAATTCQAEES